MYNDDFVERLKDAFDDMVVYKDASQNNFLSSFKLPSFLRDYVIKQFQYSDGSLDSDEVIEFINEHIPKSDQVKNIKKRLVTNNETMKILAKISVDINIKTRAVSFALPDYSISFGDTVIFPDVWDKYGDELVKSDENWGVVELGYDIVDIKKNIGKISLRSFQDFCPYDISLEEFKYGRSLFTLDEWIDVILAAIDYNPNGYDSKEKKLLMLSRLLPFVEKNVNLLELAPPGTAKSYMFGQISRYGYLVSGKVTRAKLIYDMSRKSDGVVAHKDYIALDEIREAEYMKDAELHSSLQQIMENKKYNAPDGHQVNVDAGIIFLGNIQESAMNIYSNMLTELPEPFHKSPFLDRIHGFIQGWELPRMNNDLKVNGWALNSEYFTTTLHLLRDEPYREIVESMLIFPSKADTRDSEAIIRIATGFTKLLFPHINSASDISPKDFKRYCLEPAMKMRSVIRIQMGYYDSSKEGVEVPEFKVVGYEN